MISKYYSKMALIALATASLAFAGCGGKNADSELSKPGQEVYYQSDDGTFHKASATQAQQGKQVLYYKDAQGKYHKKSAPQAAVGNQGQATDSDVTNQGQSTQAAAHVMVKPSLDSISFAFNSSFIDSAGKEALADYATWLNANRDVNVTIEGHCDERGSESYNLALGDERARKVMKVLVANGVATKRIDTVSFGEKRPVCNEANNACWRLNRRGDIVNN